jgi:hypothetical protein
MHSASATSKAYEASKKKKKQHQHTPSSDESAQNDDSGPSGSVMSSPGGPYDANLPETAWDGGVVNDISPPTSPPSVPAALNQPLFSLGPSWAFPNFGPSFASHQ